MGTVIKFLKIAGAVLGLAILAACGGGGSGTASTGTGTLSVALTDASCGDVFSEVNITVSKVRVHQSDSAGEGAAGWSDIDVNPPRKINLLTLMNGVLEELGQTPLPAGNYTQVRLVLEPNTAMDPFRNSVIPMGGAEQALDTPSAVQSGIKVIHPFTVATDEVRDLVLDFDACRSVVQRGNTTYGLKPVMRVIPGTQTAGTQTGIVGTVDLTLPGVVVSAQKDGVVIRETVPNSVGDFVLAPIDPAQSPYDVVITATDHATAVVAAVPVVANMSTQISTTATPISLPAGGTPATRAVSGTVMPAAASPTVRALQAVGTVPVVEIAHANADGMTGLYSLTLPVDAPVLATYATPLPLMFAPQGASAGQYTIEASATGYVTQTAPADVSSADVTGLDFTLVLVP